ncbi:uncharacterized protein HKW66_Vig0166880 [Vigna angularis]|uniref:Uncharacterized protein n=1 Tax=Phaseolus angularis TaxID=3914 RepID=A0A8T0JSK9_PHAAN|nr:uncharacterized protein HKW66_Vig0166880 [Vigna angularis]
MDVPSVARQAFKLSVLAATFDIFFCHSIMCVCVVYEHEEEEWETCDCRFGFEDVKVEEPEDELLEDEKDLEVLTYDMFFGTKTNLFLVGYGRGITIITRTKNRHDDLNTLDTATVFVQDIEIMSVFGSGNDSDASSIPNQKEISLSSKDHIIPQDFQVFFILQQPSAPLWGILTLTMNNKVTKTKNEFFMARKHKNFGLDAQTSNRVTRKGFKVITHVVEAELFTEKLFSLTLERNKRNGFIDSNGYGIRLEMEASPSQMPHLTKVVDVNLADGTVEKGKDEIPVPSPPIPEVATLLHSLQDASKGIVISSGKKRKGVEVLVNEDNIDKIGRIDRSPEVHTRGNGDVQLEQTYYLRREKEKLGDQTWNDEDLLLPPLVDKLNCEFVIAVLYKQFSAALPLNFKIGKLEDILIHLQKVKKLEILCSVIQSQNCGNKNVAV